MSACSKTHPNCSDPNEPQWCEYWAYKDTAYSYVGHQSKDIHIDFEFKAVLLCEGCNEEISPVREGPHFENDLHLLLCYMGEIMSQHPQSDKLYYKPE